MRRRKRMKRTPLERKSALERGDGPRRKTRLKGRNRRRIAKLRAQQFGTDGKREWILTLPCVVSWRRPVEPAHVLGTRATGAGPEGLCPLEWEVHHDFDHLPGAKFLAKWGRSKGWVRAQARELEEEWQRRKAS